MNRTKNHKSAQTREEIFANKDSRDVLQASGLADLTSHKSHSSEFALLETQSRQILSTVIAFRDGDFSVRLPTDWDGTNGRIAEAFNQAIAHEDRISQEVAHDTPMGKDQAGPSAFSPLLSPHVTLQA